MLALTASSCTRQASRRGPAEGADRPGKSFVARMAARLSRPIYPMSVIPGGAWSVAELQRHLKRDPVARASFTEHAERVGDPDLLAHVEVRRIEKPVRYHTQLRRGDELLWSKGRVTIRPGEKAFFDRRDGTMVARARCGNVVVSKLPPGARTVPAPPEPPVGRKPPVPGVEKVTKKTPPLSAQAPPPLQAGPEPDPFPPAPSSNWTDPTPEDSPTGPPLPPAGPEVVVQEGRGVPILDLPGSGWDPKDTKWAKPTAGGSGAWGLVPGFIPFLDLSDDRGSQENGGYGDDHPIPPQRPPRTPEPGTLMLLVVTLAPLAARRLRSSRAAGGAPPPGQPGSDAHPEL